MYDLDGFAFSIGADSGNFSGSVGGLSIVNNIVSLTGTGAKVFGLTTAIPDSVSIDHSLARTSGVSASLPDGRTTSDPGTFSDWTGYQRHGLTAAPGFVDAGGHDYRLKSTSPAIDIGIQVPGISDAWAGEGPDLGRYERLP